ncbi:mucin-21-like [Argopecten irradians]|uniref:mucin-21-like n=1 Tax=Argopecten irradians TaxID=31199 RepID=UPI003724585F
MAEMEVLSEPEEVKLNRSSTNVTFNPDYECVSNETSTEGRKPTNNMQIVKRMDELEVLTEPEEDRLNRSSTNVTFNPDYECVSNETSTEGRKPTNNMKIEKRTDGLEVLTEPEGDKLNWSSTSVTFNPDYECMSNETSTEGRKPTNNMKIEKRTDGLEVLTEPEGDKLNWSSTNVTFNPDYECVSNETSTEGRKPTNNMKIEKRTDGLEVLTEPEGDKLNWSSTNVTFNPDYECVSNETSTEGRKPTNNMKIEKRTDGLEVLTEPEGDKLNWSSTSVTFNPDYECMSKETSTEGRKPTNNINSNHGQHLIACDIDDHKIIAVKLQTYIRTQPKMQTQSGSGSMTANDTLSQPKVQTQTGTGSGSATGNDTRTQPKVQTQSESRSGSTTANDTLSQPKVQTQTGTGSGSATAYDTPTQPKVQTQSVSRSGSTTANDTRTQPKVQTQTGTGSGSAAANDTRTHPKVQTQSVSRSGSTTANGKR